MSFYVYNIYYLRLCCVCTVGNLTNRVLFNIGQNVLKYYSIRLANTL